MKYLFLLASLAFINSAYAQRDDLYYFKKQLENKKKPVILPKYEIPASLLDQKDQEYVLSNGNKLALLKQDNMPCVKPGMSQFNMPNAGLPNMLNPGKNVIPNPDFENKLNL